MQIIKFKHTQESGWSISPFPLLDSNRTVVYIFASPEVIQNSQILDPLLSAFPKAFIVGCSGAGEIFGSEVNDRSLSVAVVQFEHTDLALESIDIQSSGESFAAGQTLGKKLNRPGLCGIFILSDGLLVNGSQLVQGFNNSLSPEVVITGGLAGDGSNFEKTWVIQNRKARSGTITALGYYGNRLKISHGSYGGWDIFGPDRLVTESKENVLYQLDNKPALTLYKEYLGNRASELPAAGLLFPLQIRAHKSDTRCLVRTILAINEEKLSLTFAGDIPLGWTARLMRTRLDRIVDGAIQAAQMTREGIDHKSQNSLTLVVSCIGRRLVLGERVSEELEATLENLIPGTEQIGFYAYAEISPYEKEQTSQLHNQTMTLTTLFEI